VKILITGVTGFIGRALAKRLVQGKHRVYAVARKKQHQKELMKNGIKCFVDNGKTMDLISYFKREKFDGVVHLASCFISEHKPEETDSLIHSNLLFSTRILEASAISGVKWFINTGTFWQHFKNMEYLPVNLYASTKQAFEDISKFYIQNYPINFTTIKINDTYGPGDTRRKVFALWSKIAGSKEYLEMSPGEQFVDMTYIDDIVDAYVHMIGLLKNDKTKRFNGKSFAVSSGEVIKLKNLAQIYEKVSGKKLNIKWGARQYRKNEVMVPWNKGSKIPGFKPKIKYKDGIKKLIENK
jgi:CDP-paratose synthetase